MSSKKTASSKKSKSVKKQTEIIEANPVGRPSDFKAEYCQLLTDHMAKGLSFESFGGVIGVCFKTLYNWTEKFPEFLQAKDDGELKSLAVLEQAGHAGMYGQSKVDFRFWQMIMKVRFAKHGWNPDRYNITFQNQGGFDFTDDEDDDGKNQNG